MQTSFLPLGEHYGYAITLRMPDGIFDADVEGAHLVSPSLSDLKDRLKVMCENAQRRARQTVSPVSLYLVCKENKSNKIMFEQFDVLGVVAGRRYTHIVRTKQRQLEMDVVVGLAPDDGRISAVQRCLAARNAAETAFRTASSLWENLVKTLPSVEVPNADTKEVALDVESIFLQNLRDIPVERNHADDENSHIPA